MRCVSILLAILALSLSSHAEETAPCESGSEECQATFVAAAAQDIVAALQAQVKLEPHAAQLPGHSAQMPVAGQPPAVQTPAAVPAPAVQTPAAVPAPAVQTPAAVPAPAVQTPVAAQPPAVQTAEAAHQEPNAEHGTGEHEEGLEEEALAHYVIVPIGLAVIAALFLGAVLEKFHISWVPESAVTMAVGVLLGVYMKGNIGHFSLFKHEEVFSETSATLLTLFLLPMLIFEPGWSMRVKDFASQFPYICLYAIAGSLISFVTVGTLIWWTGQQGWHSVTMPRTAFAYASLIAATDPVATLGTYAKLKVDPLLNTIVMGDSIFNDAVAIVLFKVLNDSGIMGQPGSRPGLGELAGKIFGGITKIFMGSLCVGLVVASLFLLLLRLLNLGHHPRLEILALVIMAYVNFAIGEVLGMSGIIATIFCSIFLGIYARPHLSRKGALLGDFFIKQMACLMDALVFLLTGFSVVMLDTKGFVFGGWAMLFCLLGRAAAVWPVSGITNILKRAFGRARGTAEEDWHLLSPSHMFMIWHAGLRGAIALTLCMQLGPWVDVLDGPNTRHILQTATYFIICVFLLVFGGTTEAALKYLNVPMGQTGDPAKMYQTETSDRMQHVVSFLDEKIFVPMFVGSQKKADKIREEDKDTNLEDILKTALKEDERRKALTSATS